MERVVAGERVYAYTGGRQFDPTRPTLVFIHGAANDHSVWSLQSRYFAWHGNNVLAVDLPGHGRSSGAALPTVAALATWVIALLDAIPVPTAALIGHSLGSLVALHTAASRPDRVRAVALLGSAVPMTVSDALLALAAADDHHAFEFINGWSYGPARQLGGAAQPGIWLAGNSMRLMERAAPGVLHADLAACQNYAEGLDAAARVRCPALLIVGERDIMAPPANARALAAALASPRVVTLADTGHALMAEEPDAVLDALRGFL
jgi:pimeloyl-ACP methyl ester carboxylesterase